MAYSKYKKDGTLKKKPGRKPDPAKAKRPPTFVKGVERPHVWKIGPDQYKHQMYVPWMRAKAQAKFREEGFELTFEEFFALWNGLWHQRGREIDDLCMSRKDFNQAWSATNSEIITRREHLARQGFERAKDKLAYYKKGLPGPKGSWKNKPGYKKLKVD